VLAALIASLISSNLSVMNSVSTLVVRDFVVHLRPNTSERAQVYFGRLAIAVGAALGAVAAYLVYVTPDGLYKYLQTISIYLTLPIAPAIVFGIMSKRINVRGAIASVSLGAVLSTLFVTDQLMGPQTGARLFPWLHTKLTLNYTYRGLWGTLLVTLTLFLVSWMGEKMPQEPLKKLTINWHMRLEPFAGWSDWRLHLALLSLATVALYAWMW
jgi:solute:Na+ symporter, SSS family